MRLLIILFFAIVAAVVTGCGGYKVNVFGGNGSQYTAPTLCAALQACQKAGETACSYDDTLIVGPDGTTKQMSACTTVTR